MMRLDVAWLVGRFAGMEIEATICVTLVTESAPSSLVFGNKAIFLLFLWMTLAAAIFLESALSGQKGQANLLTLRPAFVAVDAVWSCAPSAILTHFHAGLRL